MSRTYSLETSPGYPRPVGERCRCLAASETWRYTTSGTCPVAQFEYRSFAVGGWCVDSGTNEVSSDVRTDVLRKGRKQGREIYHVPECL